MIKSSLKGLTALILSLFLFSTAYADPVKVGFIYVGPVGDHGWTYMHDQGRQAVVAEFGDAVETSYIENVKYGPDSERVIREMAQSGFDVIFATSFGYMDQML